MVTLDPRPSSEGWPRAVPLRADCNGDVVDVDPIKGCLQWCATGAEPHLKEASPPATQRSTLDPKRCVDALVQLFAQIICHWCATQCAEGVVPKPQALCSVLGTSLQEGHWSVQRGTVGLGKGLHTNVIRRSWGGLRMEKRRLRGTFSLCDNLTGGSQAGVKLFSQITNDRTRGFYLKFCQWRFLLDVRK